MSANGYAPVRLTVPVERLRKNPWNPNRMDDRTFNAERESIREYGFIDPILVREVISEPGEYEIIDGEHRWLGAIEEGYTEVLIDSLGVIADAPAKKLTVILNETRGRPDIALLGRLLFELEQEVSEADLRLGLPYSDVEMGHLLSLGKSSWDDYSPEGMGEPPDPTETAAVVLTYPPGDIERFHSFCAMLIRERGYSGESEAVLAVLRAAVEALTFEEGDPGEPTA